MKKNNILKVILISILVVCLCTWLFPVSYYGGGLIEDSRAQIGLFELFSYPLVALSYFGHVLLYALMVGGLYGLLNKIPAYRVCLDKIAKGFKGREWLFLVLTIVGISVLVSLTGLTLGMIVIFPIIISLILLLGYNKIVAVLSTVGATMCGIIGTTFGQDTVLYFDYLLGTDFTDKTKVKLILLVVSVAILLFNVLRYGKKTLNKVEEQKSELIPELIKVEKGKKVHVWPMVVILDLLFIILLVGIFPWSAVFKDFTWFSDALSWVQSYELFGFPIFAKILGNVGVFGSWSYTASQTTVVTALPAVILIATLILGLIYHFKFSDMIDAILGGMKKALVPGMVMLMTYVVLAVSVYHPFELTIIKPILGLVKDFGEFTMSFGGVLHTVLNAVSMSLIAFLGTFFNVDSMYIGTQLLQYVASEIPNEAVYPIVEIIFQSVYGLALLVLPTSFILMGTLSYANVSYGSWLKHVWKIFLELLIVLIIIFVILMVL